MIYRLSLLLTLLACTPGRPQNTPAVAEENWIPLFNGRDLEGWTPKFAGKPLGENFRNTFRVEDDMIRVSYDAYENFDDAYGHLYYKQPYSNYKLRFDYRFTGDQVPGGASWNVRNSGVMLHSQSAASNDPGQTFPVSIELQLLGGLDDGERHTGNVCTPGTAVVMQDTVDYRHCINSSSATYNGDRWVSAEAIVLGGKAMHFLIEGDTVLSFTSPQLGGGFTNNDAQLRDWKMAAITDKSRDAWRARDGEVLTGGYIALQAESHPIDFRNIELLPLLAAGD